MMNGYIGIDVGLTGAIAYIDDNEAHVWPMPVIKVKGKKHLDVAATDVILYDLCGTTRVFAAIERQQAFPKQGRSSVFSLGWQQGWFEGAFKGWAPFELVRPKAWQKEFGISGTKGDTKGQSIAIAQRLFPDVSLIPDGCRKPKDGMADAILIAEWMRRRCAGMEG